MKLKLMLSSTLFLVANLALAQPHFCTTEVSSSVKKAYFDDTSAYTPGAVDLNDCLKDLLAGSVGEGAHSSILTQIDSTSSPGTNSSTEVNLVLNGTENAVGDLTYTAHLVQDQVNETNGLACKRNVITSSLSKTGVDSKGNKVFQSHLEDTSRGLEVDVTCRTE